MTFLRKSLLASAGHAGVQAVNVLGTMVLARALGEGMGQYDLLRNVAVLAATVTSLGVGSANIYVLNARNVPPPRLAANTVRLLLVLGTALAAALALSIVGFGRYFGRVPAPVAAAFGVATAAMLGVTLLRPFLVAALEVRRMLAVDLVVPAVVLAGGAALRAAGRLDAAAALLLFSAAQAASLALLLALLRPHLAPRVPLDRALLRDVLRLGAQNFAANLLGILLASLTVMLLRGLSLDEGRFGPVALYTRAAALCGLAMMIPAALGPLLYARWSGAAGPDRRLQVELAARLNVAYGVAVALVLAGAGKLLLRGIYGEAFAAAQPAVYALGPAYALKALFDVYINLFASDGRAGLTAAILAGATVVAVVATWLLVPAVGFAGAGIAVLLADLACVTAAAALGWRLHRVRPSRCLVLSPADVRLVLAQLLPRRAPGLGAGGKGAPA